MLLVLLKAECQASKLGKAFTTRLLFTSVLFVYLAHSFLNICLYKTFPVHYSEIRSMILRDCMLLIFFEVNCKNQLKIVNNVVFFKLKRNFNQAMNALTNWMIFLYWQLQSHRPSQCPRALRRTLGFVFARKETSAS